MIPPLHRARNVLALVERVRERHPEMMRPVRWPQIQRVLAREQIIVIRAPIRSRAYVDGGDGTFVITVRTNLDPRLHAKVVLHEYAHAKLHLTERGEVVRQVHPCVRGDPREHEANLFALLLWLGPTATPDHPDVARLVAKLEGTIYVRPSPAQTELAIPTPAPVFRAERKRVGPARRPVKSPLGSPYFDWSKEGKPLGWFHPEVGWIDIYDGMEIEQDGRRRWVLLKVGDRRAQRRLFVRATSNRREHRFADGETRSRERRLLDYQFRIAEDVMRPGPQPIFRKKWTPQTTKEKS